MSITNGCRASDDYACKIARLAQLGLMPSPHRYSDNLLDRVDIDGHRRENLPSSAQKKFRRWSRRLNGQTSGNGTGWVLKERSDSQQGSYTQREEISIISQSRQEIRYGSFDSSLSSSLPSQGHYLPRRSSPRTGSQNPVDGTQISRQRSKSQSPSRTCSTYGPEHDNQNNMDSSPQNLRFKPINRFLLADSPKPRRVKTETPSENFRRFCLKNQTVKMNGTQTLSPVKIPKSSGTPEDHTRRKAMSPSPKGNTPHNRSLERCDNTSPEIKHTPIHRRASEAERHKNTSPSKREKRARSVESTAPSILPLDANLFFGSKPKSRTPSSSSERAPTASSSTSKSSSARRRLSSQDKCQSLARGGFEKQVQDTPRTCVVKSSKKGQPNLTPVSADRADVIREVPHGGLDGQKATDLKPKAIIKPGLRSAKKDSRKSPFASKSEEVAGRKLVQSTLHSFFNSARKENSASSAAPDSNTEQAGSRRRTSKDSRDSESKPRSHVRRIYQDESPKLAQPVVRLTLLRDVPKDASLADRKATAKATWRLAQVLPMPSPAKVSPKVSPNAEDAVKDQEKQHSKEHRHRKHKSSKEKKVRGDEDKSSSEERKRKKKKKKRKKHRSSSPPTLSPEEIERVLIGPKPPAPSNRDSPSKNGGLSSTTREPRQSPLKLILSSGRSTRQSPIKVLSSTREIRQSPIKLKIVIPPVKLSPAKKIVIPPVKLSPAKKIVIPTVKVSPAKKRPCGSPALGESPAKVARLSPHRREVPELPVSAGSPSKPSPSKKGPEPAAAVVSPFKRPAPVAEPVSKTSSPAKSSQLSPAKEVPQLQRPGAPGASAEEDDAQVRLDEVARKAEAARAAQRNKKRHTRGRKVFVYCDVLDEHIERHPVQNEIPADKWSKWLNPSQLRCLTLAMLANTELCLKYSLEAERHPDWEQFWVVLAIRLNTICYNELTNLNTGLRMTVLEWKTLWLEMKAMIQKRLDAMKPEEKRHSLGSLECLLYSEDLYNELMKSNGACLGQKCPRVWCHGACVGVSCPVPTRRRLEE